MSEDNKKILNVVIIGTSAHEDNQGKTPSLEDIESSIILAENNDYTLNIIFVDPNYYYLKFIDEESPLFLQKEKKLVNSLKKYSSFIEDFYYRSNLSFDEEDNCIFISFIKPIKNTYEFMDFIESWMTTNKYFIIPDRVLKLNLSEIIEDFFSNKLKNPYDIYLAKELPVMSKDDFMEIKKIMLTACELNIWYIKAEFHDEKTGIPKIVIPSWTFNTEIPILKGIIMYYKLYNENKIHRPANEICESAEYRKLLTEILSKTIANFAVNNKLIKMKEVEKGWFHTKTYSLIMKRINEMKY